MLYHPPSQVLIIGAGKMSKLLVKHMHSKGCKRMTILNRSMPRAEALAEEFPEVHFDIHLMSDLMKVRFGACLRPAGGPHACLLPAAGAVACVDALPACGKMD